MSRRVLSVVMLATVVVAPLTAQQPALPPELERYVTEVMADHEVPGLALAIVKDGQVLMARGFGVRTLGTDA